jgi:hypothetical protein
MQWAVKKLLTEDDGEVNTIGSNIVTIFNDISVNETVGDELYLKAGDLVLKRYGALQSSVGGYKEWIALYIDDILFNIYEFDENAYEQDQKRGIYTYRFKSIQKKFFENIENHQMYQDNTTTDYNYGLSNIAQKLYDLSVKKGDGIYSTFTQRWGFPIGSVLDGLEGKHNDYGYQVGTVTHPMKLPNGTYDLPFLWRGMGVPDNVSDRMAINETFYVQKYYDLTVSGITTPPLAYSSIYSHNGDNYLIIDVNLVSGAGTIRVRNISDESTPQASGTFTKVSGVGDSTFSFSSYTTETEYYYTTWKEIFEIASIGWNAFVRIFPKIEGTPQIFKVDIDVIPKIEETAAGQITDVIWSERKKIKRKFAIDGISISTLNWEYTLGNSKRGFIFSKSVPVATREQSNSNWENDLYIGISEQDQVHQGYYYRLPANFFFHTGGGDEFIKQWYENQIGASDCYEGIVNPKYNDGSDKLIRILDQLQFNSTTIQLNSIQIKKNFLANIEGIVL